MKTLEYHIHLYEEHQIDPDDLPLARDTLTMIGSLRDAITNLTCPRCNQPMSISYGQWITVYDCEACKIGYTETADGRGSLTIGSDADNTFVIIGRSFDYCSRVYKLKAFS